MVEKNNSISKKEKVLLTLVFWFFGLMVIIAPFLFYLLQPEDELPPVSMHDNPPELLASEVIAKTELGQDTIIGH